MNTTQLQCFLTVADTLNFSMAAERLNLTQPAITHQIQSLEDELGVRLFNRSSRSVRLTPEGKQFLYDADHILLTAEQAKRNLAQSPRTDWQYFSIGCHDQKEFPPMYPILRQMRKEIPNLYPSLRTVPFSHIYSLLEEDEADVVVSFRDRYRKASNIRYREFAKIAVSAIMPKSCPLAVCESLRTPDLKEYSLILIDPGKSPEELARVNSCFMQDHPSSMLYICESVESAQTLAKAGFGIAVFPDIRPIPDHVVKTVPLTDLPPMSYGAYYKNLKGNAILKKFLELQKIARDKNIVAL